MKEQTDLRLKNAKEVTKDTLVEKIKTTEPTRFDQMLIESEERKTYYYVKYNSIAFTRTPKTLKFPLFKDLVNDFEKSIEQSGETKILEDSVIIQKVIAKGKSPIDTPKYSGKNLVFSELKLATDGDKVKQKQPIYYLPSETERCTCNTCRGDMYTTCTETECRGQHIYDCNKCRTTGKLDCDDCNARGEYPCPSCNGRGSLKCSSCGGSGRDKSSNSIHAKCKDCNGSGERKCSSYNKTGSIKSSSGGASLLGGMANLAGAAIKKATGNEYCGGSGIIRCKKCSATGKITCDKCEGDGRIECKTCYGDRIDDRYGKVDCKTCETAGELASISYIETDIKSDNLDLIFTDGKKIDEPNFGVNTIKKYANANGQLVLTYKNLNGENKELYDEYSTFCSKNSLTQVGTSKERYPKLIAEEMYYEGVPCATFNYNHILSATFHDVSVLSIDKEKDVLFHSNPTAVAEEKESFKERVNELCRKAFSTKAFKDKIDRKHEMFLMVHMAKADGVIEEQEKRYLAQTITGLHGFTNKEKAELFGLMSSSTLPPILPTNAYFSSKERAEEARKKIVELVAKADGEYEPEEKAKIEEINKAIELGYKAKPSAFGRFFSTWQVSISLILLLCLAGFGTYFFATVYPQILAERKAKRALELEKMERQSDSLLNTMKSDTEKNVKTESNSNTNNQALKAAYKDSVDIVEKMKKDSAINQINSSGDGAITETLILTGGSCDEGCNFVFKTEDGIPLTINQIPDHSIELEQSPEGMVIKQKYLNKKYKVTYFEQNNDNGREIIASKIDAVK